MTATAQQRAVIEALSLSPAELRELAHALEQDMAVTLVAQIVEDTIADLPDGHRYVSALRRLARWAGDRDASTVQADEIARWAQQGLLPCQRTLGGHRRYPEPAIRELAASPPPA